MKDGKVVAFGSSFVKFGEKSIRLHFATQSLTCTTDKIAPSQPSIDKNAAIAAAEAALGCTHDSYPTSLQYLANPDGSASLVHVFQLKNDEVGKYYQAHVDAHSGKLLSTVDFVAEATVSRPQIRIFQPTHKSASILSCQSLKIPSWMANP
jgi:extracellular elastinolytic metalloproteinase